MACLSACRRASEEIERLDPNTPLPDVVEHVDPRLVEHQLPSVALAAPTAGPIGTAHPTTLIQAAKNARWVVACQARDDSDNDGSIEVHVGHHGDLYGDVMRPYLFRGGGAGEPIQELVAVSPDERFLAVMRSTWDGDKLVLIDDTNGRETTITDADVRSDQRGRSRVAEFDADSKRLIYFRASSPGTIVIRELATPRERVVRMPDVRAWTVMAETGPFARFLFIRTDTDKNGILDWPTINTTAAIGEVCTGPAMSYSTFGGGGDDFEVAWLDVEPGTLREDTSVLAHVGNAELVRDKDGSIRLGTTTIVPATCKASVHAVLPSPLRVVVVCADKRYALAVDIFGPSFHTTLEMRADPTTTRPPRVLTEALFCQNAETCFDLVSGTRLALQGSMSAQHGTRMLTRDRDKMYWYATATATPVHVPNIDGYYANETAGSLVSLDKGIVDLATGRVLGYAPKTPLALDQRGRVLVPADDERGLPTGPLTWADPQPQPPPKSE